MPEKRKSGDDKSGVDSKNKNEKENLGSNKKINMLDMFLSKGEMYNKPKIIDNINKEPINGDMLSTDKNMNVNKTNKMHNLFLDEEKTDMSKTKCSNDDVYDNNVYNNNVYDNNVHNNNVHNNNVRNNNVHNNNIHNNNNYGNIYRNDNCVVKSNECNNNGVELDEDSNYQNMVHNQMLEGRNYMNNLESSTEDDIIIKKKRKIILDSVSDKECSDAKENNINKNNCSVDNKLTNLLYEPNKEIDDNLLLLDDNNNNNIKKMYRKKKRR